MLVKWDLYGSTIAGENLIRAQVQGDVDGDSVSFARGWALVMEMVPIVILYLTLCVCVSLLCLDLMQATLKGFASLGVSSTHLEIHYEYQHTKASLGQHAFQYSPRALAMDISYFLEFWQGHRAPGVVMYVPSTVSFSLI